ncbi:MAG: two-component sensor histidine kinase [Rhodanobacter denitrificans]|uniref:histidine kinase n=1 Tax=Rhodanobacter denitrificans TaxID=666685 RepID=A0A2W5KQW2_9GAMM|nr:MAG: two-component sensor histidine kinase [Rhodanobacter denitrificans]
MIVFGLTMLAALAMQSFSSQRLIEHRFWADLLAAVSADHAARVAEGHGASLPHGGIVRSWYWTDGGTPPEPAYLADLPAGYYSTESGFFGAFRSLEDDDRPVSFHVRVLDLPHGRLITMVDIEALENQQNHDSLLSVGWAVIFAILIGAVIGWLHANLVRPVRDLAERMQAIDPSDTAARLPMTYTREEIQMIAQASNAHLERVAQFVARERSLLDQASHEFRTPIAVIAGAADVLGQMPLPEAARPVLGRIEHAVTDLSETMVALLYLAREPDPESEPVDVTALHELLPRLARDHEHLLRDKSARLTVGVLVPTFIAAPEAIVRIAVSNLLRNAIEHTEAGSVEIALEGSTITVTDSGSGFDPVEVARRYRDSLRHAAPVRGQGLGLFLICRICDRFGWRLAIESGGQVGTRARLDVEVSVIAP